MNIREQILKTANSLGTFRPSDVENVRYPDYHLRRMVEEGLLRKVNRGLYSLSDLDPELHHSLAEAAKAVPRGIACLISALNFHEFTTQLPYQHWMAVNHNGPVAVGGLPIRIIRMKGIPFEVGVEEHIIEGIAVKVFNPAKTVVDCFRYRRAVGLDVALEALREGWRYRKYTIENLTRYARICGVDNSMRPYVEMMVA